MNNTTLSQSLELAQAILSLAVLFPVVLFFLVSWVFWGAEKAVALASILGDAWIALCTVSESDSLSHAEILFSEIDRVFCERVEESQSARRIVRSLSKILKDSLVCEGKLDTFNKVGSLVTAVSSKKGAKGRAKNKKLSKKAQKELEEFLTFAGI